MVQLAGSTETTRPTCGPAQASPRGGARSSLATTLLCALGLLTAVAGGCRSRAYQDVYVDKLTGEIRALEDQLYEADYANQVLQQKLARYEARQQAARSPADRLPADASSAADPSDLDIRIDRGRRSDSGSDSASDLELEIDLGQPMTPENGPPRGPDEAPAAGDSEALPPPSDSFPPVEPLPPRAGEFEMPSIELGEPLPPGEPDEEDALPPGQIPTPESARKLYPATPTAVSIHPGLSGRHHHDSDDVEDGIFLVLTVTDAEGRAIPCEEPVSVVVLDPAHTGESARLGRWDFSAKEVAEKFHSTPVPSIQLPILWEEARPAGDSVAVFVRVMTDTEQPLETDMLMEFTLGSGAEWTSRGLGTPAASSAGIDPETAWK